jgi:hypothetical protein
MNPMVVGGGVAAILAGPPLYGLVQAGQMDGSTAILRGLLVAVACGVGASFVLRIITGYEKEWARQARIETLLEAADAEAKRQDEELAAQVAAQVMGQGTGQPPNPS